MIQTPHKRTGWDNDTHNTLVVVYDPVKPIHILLGGWCPCHNGGSIANWSKTQYQYPIRLDGAGDALRDMYVWCGQRRFVGAGDGACDVMVRGI